MHSFDYLHSSAWYIGYRLYSDYVDDKEELGKVNISQRRPCTNNKLQERVFFRKKYVRNGMDACRRKGRGEGESKKRLKNAV